MEEQKLNLGCGREILPGWLNVDIIKMSEEVSVLDLSYAWPWPENKFTRILANHILEHIFEKVHVMEEIWRVGAPGCLVEIRVPDFRHENAYMDPTHRSYWHVNNIDFFEKGHEYKYITGAQFEILKKRTDGQEIYWKLKVVKGGK